METACSTRERRAFGFGCTMILVGAVVSMWGLMGRFYGGGFPSPGSDPWVYYSAHQLAIGQGVLLVAIIGWTLVVFPIVTRRRSRVLIPIGTAILASLFAILYGWILLCPMDGPCLTDGGLVASFGFLIAAGGARIALKSRRTDLATPNQGEPES